MRPTSRHTRLRCRGKGTTLDLLAAPLLLLLLGLPALAAPPSGQSALLNGMHDMQAESWMIKTTPGCDKGWITDLQYIGTSGTPGANCHTSATKAGISIIQRLDASGSQSIPKNKAQAPGYGKTFAAFVSKCPNIHVWIVGNEPNFTFNDANPDCSSGAYAAAYVEVHKRVHALAGHTSDLVLVAPNSPYSPGCLQSLRRILDKIKAAGVKPDGFSLHAYTQADSGSTLNSGYITHAKTANDSGKDKCSQITWNETWFWNFRIYRDYIKKVIEPRGYAGLPVFITESGNACKVQKGNKCYPDANIGYFQAMYAEINSYNQNPANKTKVRAITPYRWTSNDDGTGRDFAIGKRNNLLADLGAAFAKKYAWTKPGCGGPQPTGCSDDDGCSGKQICDLATGTCKATSACGSNGSCPAGHLCRKPQNDCVPRCRGAAGLQVTPGQPKPGASITLDASATPGYTNVGMKLRGPQGGSISAKWGGHKKISGKNHWYYSATVAGAGTHRATFTADPAKTTIYAIAYFNVVSGSAAKDKGSPAVDSGGSPKDQGKAGQDGSGEDGPGPGADGLPPQSGDAPQAGGQDIGGGCSCDMGGGGVPWSGLQLLLLAFWVRRRSI